MRRPLTRRTVLAGGAGLAALASCGPRVRAHAIEGGFADSDVGIGHRLRDGSLPRPDPGALPRSTQVLIVGGGVAGLSAAWRLSRAGFEDYAVLELGAAPGGTARGGETAGLAHPWGAHYLPLPRAGQRALVAFLEEAGIVSAGPEGVSTAPENLVRAPQERVCGLGFWEEGLWLRAGATARDRQELARFEVLVREHLRRDDQGRRLFDLPLAHSSPAHHALDQESAAAWAARHDLVGERMRWYLEYATRDDFGCALDETSAWALLHYFCARADLASGESPEYLTWPEGNARLVAGLAARLGDRLLTGRAVSGVSAGSVELRVDAFERDSGRPEPWAAAQVILATPQFLARRLLRTSDPAADARARLRYAPWVVANLHLERPPVSRGFPRAWDNVLLGSPSLGYVDATHQLDRMDAHDTVWTWYLPLIGPHEADARAELLAAPWEHWRDVVLADLHLAHPDLARRVSRIDVWRWGHAMVKPVPGLLWGGDRARIAAPVAGGRITFAHTDLSGMALFEEAHWQGVRAAEETLARRGVGFESLL